MTNHTARLRISILSLVMSSLVVGCTLGGSAKGGDTGVDRPTADDVAGRQAVPAISILTKTQAKDPTRFEMARLIAQSWNSAGIKTTVLPVGAAELSSRTFTGKNYDVYVISYDGTPARLDPDNLLGRFYSPNATTGGTNISLYKNTKFDEAYRAQQQAADEEGRQTAVRSAQEILYEQQPAVPVVYPNIGAAYRSDKWDGVTVTAASPVFSVYNSTSATPKSGQQVLVVGTTTEPSTFNPVTAALAQDQTPLSLVYDTLLTLDPKGELKARAAAEYKVDGKKITLTLRPGLLFSDGQPVRPQDVAFSINYLRTHDAPLYAPILKDVKSVSVDSSTVSIELNQPQASFPAVALAQMPILPEHVWSGIPDPAKFRNSAPIGSGPFVLESRRPGESITFRATRQFYEPAQIATLRLAILASFDAAVGALTSGEIDVIDSGNTVSTQYKALQNKAGISVVTLQSHGWRGLHYNTSKAPFDDRHFRRALTALIPYDEIVDVAYQGDATPGGSVIAPALKSWHLDSLTPREYSPENAMDELRRAGYAFGPDSRLYYPASSQDNRIRDNNAKGSR